jgi:hypothetical protein
LQSVLRAKFPPGTFVTLSELLKKVMIIKINRKDIQKVKERHSKGKNPILLLIPHKILTITIGGKNGPSKTT